MARTTSIFYNLQNYKDDIPNSARYHLDDIMDSSYQPRAVKERIQKLAIEIKSAKSLTTSIENLFIVLNLRLEDLDKYELTTLYKQLRIVLKKQACIEIAPPGNPVTLEKDTKFKITPTYELNNDPDIIAALQFTGANRMNELIGNRIKKAKEKINGFVVMLHVFEALSVVTVNSELNIEQRNFINKLIEESLYPAEGKVYLQTCFTQFIDNGVRENILDDEGCAIKVIKDEKILASFLSIMSQLAILAREKPKFNNYKYANVLNTFYDNNKPLEHNDNFHKKVFKSRSSFELFAEHTALPPKIEFLKSKLQEFKDIQLRSMNFSRKSISSKYKKEALTLISDLNFYVPQKMHFYTGNNTVYIDNIAIQNANIYKCSVDAQNYQYFGFAVNTQNFRIGNTFEEYKYFSDLDADQCRRFALLLQHPNETNYINNLTGDFIAANLAYRIFVEGFFDLITTQERQVAFMWLMQWYNIIYNLDDNTMHYLNNTLQSFGLYISLYAILYPKDITTEQLEIIHTQKYFSKYAEFKLAINAYKANLTLDTSIDSLFTLFIASNPAYYNKIRASGSNSILLYKMAKNTFKEFAFQHEDEFTSYLQKLQNRDISYTNLNTSFLGLNYYLNNIICTLLPGNISIDITSSLCKQAITYIDNKQKALLQYILKGNINTRNELIYRILELSCSPKVTKSIPKSIEIIKNNLLEMSIVSFEKIKQLISLNISNRLYCINILEQCSSILNLTMVPCSSYEGENTSVSAYNFMVFSKQKLVINNDFPKYILPFRLALDCATSYTAMDNLLCCFKNNMLSLKNNFTEDEYKSLIEYASTITSIKQQKGGSFHASFILKNVNTDEYFVSTLTQYLTIILAMCEQSITIKNIKVLAHYLPIPNLKQFTTATYSPTRMSTNLGSQNNGYIKNTVKDLDMTLVSQKTKETSKVQQLLAPIFSDETNIPTDFEKEAPADLSDILNADGKISGEAIFKHLPTNCQQLLKRLLQLQEFSSDEFKKLCAEVGLMSEGALEIINNWALEQFECTLIEEDEPMFFDKELLSELLNK